VPTSTSEGTDRQTVQTDKHIDIILLEAALRHGLNKVS